MTRARPVLTKLLSALGVTLLTAALASDLACAVSASAGSQSGNGVSGAEPGRGDGKPARGAADGGSAGDPAPGAGAPAPAACTPVVNDLATSLFAGRVLIKLPRGVELVEQNGFYAQMAAPQQATSCGAQVHYAAVGFFQQPAGASVQQVRDQLLELRGIPSETVTWSEEGTRGRNYTGAYAATQDPKTGAPPTRGWMVLREAANDKYAYFALFETDEASFAGLLPVFQESGRNLLVKPRALQGGEAPPQPPPAEEPKKPKKTSGKTSGTITGK